MSVLHFTSTHRPEPFKPLNATNGGPWHKRHAIDQWKSNFEAYKAARIPYARNHDSAMCDVYGGPYSHDVTCIFPDFDADPDDPASYDFACTDEAVESTLEAGTRTFFRLGQTIEHQVRKHGTLPPADFGKWAVICEHIIRHYTEGWADGLRLDMPYWEIWNEADIDADDSPNKRTWGGTKAQFFDFYEVAAKHLKHCFPHLKIGGPALGYREDWAEDFLREMHRRGVEIDFFSWHIYTTDPRDAVRRAERIRTLLDRCGYEKAESILNEWNYIRGWQEEFVDSLSTIHGSKGAAFLAAFISAMQPAPVDMLMYYDTRPSSFNGVFDFYTARPLKGYCPMLWYGGFYDLTEELRADDAPQDLYALCGRGADGRVRCMLTHYSDDDTLPPLTVTPDFGTDGEYEVYRMDAAHDGECVAVTADPTVTLPVGSCVLLQQR